MAGVEAKPVKLASSIPSTEQAKINRQKLLMTDDKAEMFQGFCESIYSEKVSDKQKAKKLTNAWLFCLGFGPETNLNPLKLASTIKKIIERARARGVKPKAFQKMRAMFDVKKMMTRK